MANSRENMMAVFRNQVPEGVPLACYQFMLANGKSERIARENGLGIIDHFSTVSMISPPYFARYECLSRVKNADFSINFYWEGARLVEIHKFETPVGQVTQHVVKEPGYGSYYRKKHYITDTEDYKIVQYLVENTVFHQRCAELSKRKRELGEDGVVFSRLDRSPYQKMLIELARPETFFVDLHERPAIVEELMETIGHRLEEQFKMGLESEAEIVWAPDNVTSDMTPPYHFAKYVVPYYDKFGEQCERAGKVFAVHMDGKLNALKEHISKTPIHVIESFSLPEVGGDLPIAAAKKAFSDKAICPNFPSPISEKSKDYINAYLESVFSEFGREKPFMIELSEDIPGDHYEHVMLTLSEFVKEQGNR